jgi:hypothetical protein
VPEGKQGWGAAGQLDLDHIRCGHLLCGGAPYSYYSGYTIRWTTLCVELNISHAT